MRTPQILFLLWLWTTAAKAHRTSLCVDLCPPCFPQRIANECPEVTHTCTELVKEPGCGCCMVCALQVGERCGVNRPKCARGLACLGRHGKISIKELIHNKGFCQKPKPDREEQRQDNTQRTPTPRSYPTVMAQLRGIGRRRRQPRHPHVGLLAPLNHDGPCTEHYEEMLTSCRAMPESVWLPNCHRGYYARHQCMSSKRAKPGKCWCVDRNGNPLPNTPFTAEKPINCNRLTRA